MIYADVRYQSRSKIVRAAVVLFVAPKVRSAAGALAAMASVTLWREEKVVQDARKVEIS